MKKLLNLTFVLFLCFILTSCGNEEVEENTDPIIGRWIGMDFMSDGLFVSNTNQELKKAAVESVVACSEDGSAALLLLGKEYIGTWEPSISTDESKLYNYILHLDVDYVAYIKEDNLLYVTERANKEQKEIGVRYRKE